jgi:hypothetical protein
VLKIDTGLAEKSLESLDVNTGCFVPHNLKDKVFTHFTADNIDINDSTLDGKNKVLYPTVVKSGSHLLKPG